MLWENIIGDVCYIVTAQQGVYSRLVTHYWLMSFNKVFKFFMNVPSYFTDQIPKFDPGWGSNP